MVVVLVVFGSAKGSPGVSCLTAAVAAWLCRDVGRGWACGGQVSGRVGSVMVIDADPSGGVFAMRAGLAAHPGMVSMAARTRGGALSAVGVAAHVQVLRSRAGVLVGPLAANQARSDLDVLAERLGQFARSRPASELFLADAGRMDTDSAARPLVRSADGVVLVVWADREGLEQAAAWLRAAPELAGRVAVVARQPLSGVEYSAQEISDGLAVQVLGHLPEDQAATRAFTGAPPWKGGPRGGWWRSAGQIAEQVRRLARTVPEDPVLGSVRAEREAGRA